MSGSSDRDVCRAFEHVVGCVDGVRRHDTLTEVHRSWLACRVVVSALFPGRVEGRTVLTWRRLQLVGFKSRGHLR